MINLHCNDDRKQERRQEEYKIVRFVLIEKMRRPVRIENRVTFLNQKNCVVPGIKPGLLGQNANALPIAPPSLSVV